MSLPGLIVDLPQSISLKDQFEILVRVVKAPFYPNFQ